MKKILLLFSFVSFFVIADAQQQDANTLHETAKSLMREGDYDHALSVLNQALQLQPNDLSILEDQAFVYYLQRDFANSIKIGEPLVARFDADVQCFQVLGLAYRATAQYKECDKMYKDGIQKFPASGILHNDYGEMLSEEKLNADAIKQWEAGIESDPNCSSNYYNAAKYYDAKGNMIWVLLYGETFINIESLSKRTDEIKELLLNGYKKLYSTTTLQTTIQNGTPFEKAVASIYNNNRNITNTALSPETLTELSTRFMLAWDEKYAAQFPFHLFDFHKRLLEQGMFDAYNQWIFGALISSTNFDAWVKANGPSMAAFQHFQGNVMYKNPNGQYYPH